MLGLTHLLPGQWDRTQWPSAKLEIAEVFLSRSRDDWCTAFAGTESCFAPVLTLDEAPQHPHLQARGTYVEVDGVTQPAPAPRFSRTPAARPNRSRPWQADEADEILGAWLDPGAIARAREVGVID